MPSIAETLRAHVPPNAEGKQYTVPTLAYTENGERKHVMGSSQVARLLDRLQPEPSLGDLSDEHIDKFNDMLRATAGPIAFVLSALRLS